MENEIWKDIEGYEGLYKVSTCGKVKSLERYRNGKNESKAYVKERILRPGKDGSGYLFVVLSKECKEKTFKIHRLVAQAFIPNPEHLQDINHKDEIKTNNYASNLEWCTRQYNINYGSHNERMRKTKSKKCLCIDTNQVYESTMEVERQTGISNGCISSCCNGRQKTAGGYHWKYVE